MVVSSRDEKPLAICLLPFGSCFFFHPITNQAEIGKEMDKVKFTTVQRMMFQAK
jgi:hypothetical protein